LNLAPLITHRFALTDYQAALDTLVGRQSKTLKVLLIHDWDGKESAHFSAASTAASANESP